MSLRYGPISPSSIPSSNRSSHASGPPSPSTPSLCPSLPPSAPPLPPSPPPFRSGVPPSRRPSPRFCSACRTEQRLSVRSRPFCSAQLAEQRASLFSPALFGPASQTETVGFCSANQGRTDPFYSVLYGQIELICSATQDRTQHVS